MKNITYQSVLKFFAGIAFFLVAAMVCFILATGEANNHRNRMHVVTLEGDTLEVYISKTNPSQSGSLRVY